MTELHEGQVRFWRAPDLDDLELLHARYSRCDFPRHIHERYVIALMVGGAEELALGRCVYTVPAGRVVLINPGEAHRNRSVGDCGTAYRSFYPTAGMISRLAACDDERGSSTPSFRAPILCDPKLHVALVQLHKRLERPSSSLESETALSVNLRRLLPSDAAAPAGSNSGAERRQVRLAREYLDACYERNTSLSALAVLAGLSRFQLLRSFKKEVGLPPAQYQTHVRVREAKRLLLTGCSLAETAVQVGFVDQSHFTRSFKRLTGVTPGVYASRNSIQDAL